MGDDATLQATFCATLVDEWVRAGVRHAVVAPGSRSTPMALALAARPELALHVHHDERAAAFTALGIGRATGGPALVLCTSGTAATHLHAAVVEAHHAGVPLVALTADRPPELQDLGAAQTIDQTHLYGRAVRWFHDPGVAAGAARGSWRSLAARAVLAATGAGPGGGRPGPVHLNLPFREPLVADPEALPPGAPDGGPTLRSDRLPAAGLATAAEARPGRTVVVLGEGARWPAAPAGVPVVASPLAHVGRGVTPISHLDALLRVPAVAEALRPDAVVRDGPLSSRVVGEWLAASGATQRTLSPAWDDPHHLGGIVSDRLPVDGSPEEGWAERWARLDAAADVAIAEVLADHPEPTEPGTARRLLAALPAGARLVVSSSMPVRDLEWYARPRPDVVVHANRGANGIDGVISTALGVALGRGDPTACLLGDVAFHHDATGLLGLARRGVPLVVVVVDNDGGGIFSFLPQARSVPAERFELLYGTPHGTRPENLAAAHGLPTTTAATLDELADAVGRGLAATTPSVVAVRTDRAANVALHDDLHAAVASAAFPLL